MKSDTYLSSSINSSSSSTNIGSSILTSSILDTGNDSSSYSPLIPHINNHYSSNSSNIRDSNSNNSNINSNSNSNLNNNNNNNSNRRVTSSSSTASTASNMVSSSITNSIHIMGLLGIVSLAFSFYLAFGNVESGTCDISSTVSCSAVIKSSYGYLLNVPVSIFGITWNLVLLMGLWRIMVEDSVPHFISAIYIWCSIGIGFVLYFIASEVIIGALCPFCTIVHVINVILMVISFRLYNELRSPPTIQSMVYTLRKWFVVIAVMHLVALYAFQGYGQLEKLDEPAMFVFSKCLTEHNMIFYGSSQCHACTRQKQLFLSLDPEIKEQDAPWKYIKFVECYKNQECIDRDIQRYPTWIRYTSDELVEVMDKHEGIMNPFELSKMADCEYKDEKK